MAREDWYYPNLERGLIDEVEKVIVKSKEHGIKKYKDKKDFIVKAIKAQLDQECSH